MMNQTYQQPMMQQHMPQAKPNASCQVTPQTSNHGNTQTNVQVNANTHQEEYHYADHHDQEDEIATDETEFYTLAIKHGEEKLKHKEEDDPYWTFAEEEETQSSEWLNTEYMPEDYDSVDI